MSDTVSVVREGDLVIISLQRPHTGNAIDGPTLDELRRQMIRLGDSPPRCVILQGKGDHFSRGFDLDRNNPAVQRLSGLIDNRDIYRLGEVNTALRKSVEAISRLPVLTIAAIEGDCLGLGWEVALACDVRIASTGARFAMNQTHIGMVPSLGGMASLVRLIGHPRAVDLTLTGRTLDTAAAEALGLVSESCAPGAALDTARIYALRVLEQAPRATQQALLALRAMHNLGEGDCAEIADQAGARALASGELLKAVRAGGKPEWSA